MKEITLTPLAEGRTAEIFVWDETHVLKLYRDWCPRDWVENESRIAHYVYSAGIPTPEAGEIVEVNARRGLIYERLEGISMLQELNARPWGLFKHARALAELHSKIHQQSIPGLPSYTDQLRYNIQDWPALTEERREKLLARLETLPVGQSLCHGDFHPGNVILSQNGPVVIDWMTARSGHPGADVARTSVLLTIGPKGAGNLLSPPVRMFIMLYHRAYLNHYHASIPDSKSEWKRWLPVIAAARLNENILPEREALMELIERDS
jgi:uncharacterized protein (TIGR02172 family)